MNEAGASTTPIRVAPPAPTVSGLWFSSFSFLSSAAILLHQLHETGFSRPNGFDVLLNLAALWNLLRPGSVVRFLTLCAAQIVACGAQLPFVWNHWAFVALANVSVLAAAARLALRARGRLAGVELLAAIAPVLRLELVLLYWIAALAKLNSAYFDPRHSCAVSVYEQLTTRFPFLPTGAWSSWAAIWGSVAAEIVLPILLLVPRTRVAGLFAGGAFHLVLGIYSHYDFSAVLLPFYCLFVPAELWASLLRLDAASPRLVALRRTLMRLARSPFALPVVALAAVLVVEVGHLAGVGEHRLRVHLARGGKVLWLALCAALFLCLVAALRRSTGRHAGAALLRLPDRGALLGPLLVVATGIAPYLGLHTERAFAMFSNLQTEGDRWNHFFLPRSLRVFAFQDRIYEIVDSTDPVLQEVADRRMALVPFEIRRRLSAAPEASVTYRSDGRRRQLDRAGDDPEISRPLNPILARLFWFRPVARNGGCVH